jgi:hypothetical protein
VTFISIHSIIIYVVFFDACMRCTRLCPLKPGCDTAPPASRAPGNPMPGEPLPARALPGPSEPHRGPSPAALPARSLPCPPASPALAPVPRPAVPRSHPCPHPRAPLPAPVPRRLVSRAPARFACLRHALRLTLVLIYFNFSFIDVLRRALHRATILLIYIY